MTRSTSLAIFLAASIAIVLAVLIKFAAEPLPAIPPPPPVSAPAPAQVSAVEAKKADELVPPKFAVSLAIFNGKEDSGTSCSTSGLAFIDGPARSITGGMTCGYAGASSKLEWWYLGHSAGKDRYRFARTFPVDAPTHSTTEILVDVDGRRRVLFEDDKQVIVLRPASPRPNTFSDDKQVTVAP